MKAPIQVAVKCATMEVPQRQILYRVGTYNVFTNFTAFRNIHPKNYVLYFTTFLQFRKIISQWSYHKTKLLTTFFR